MAAQPEHRCANNPCRNVADHVYRSIGLERWLCPSCVQRLNAIGFGFERIPAWRQRAAEGLDKGKVLVA